MEYYIVIVHKSVINKVDQYIVRAYTEIEAKNIVGAKYSDADYYVYSIGTAEYINRTTGI